MTPTGSAIVEVFREMFEAMRELEKTAPGDVDRLVAMLVGHIRAWRPESITPLGDLGPPTEVIRDPRSGR